MLHGNSVLTLVAVNKTTGIFAFNLILSEIAASWFAYLSSSF